MRSVGFHEEICNYDLIAMIEMGRKSENCSILVCYMHGGFVVHSPLFQSQQSR